MYMHRPRSPSCSPDSRPSFDAGTPRRKVVGLLLAVYGLTRFIVHQVRDEKAKKRGATEEKEEE